MKEEGRWLISFSVHGGAGGPYVDEIWYSGPVGTPTSEWVEQEPVRTVFSGDDPHALQVHLMRLAREVTWMLLA